MTQESWYAVVVRARSESMVAANLRHKGYEPFVPTYRTRMLYSDRVKIVERPLVPGYVFCRIDIRTRLPILITPGVHSIVGIGKTPAPISDAEIDAIRAVVESGLMYEPHPYLAVGQKVRVKAGALDGLIGMITEVRHRSRLIISVDLLMRSVAVEIDRTWVEPIAQAQPCYPVVTPHPPPAVSPATNAA